MSKADLVATTSPADGVRVLQLNRPEKRNALSQDLIDRLLAELSVAKNDPAVRVLIITGAGSCFSGR